MINSLDRLVSLKYPHKFRLRKQFKYQALILSVVFLVLLASNTTYIFFEGIFKGETIIFKNYHKTLLL